MTNKNEKQVVDTKLVLNEKQEAVASEVSKEIMEDEIKNLPPIKEGQVNISGAYVFDDGEGLETQIYIRNGLNRPVNFEKVPLALVNSKNEIVINQIFELEEIGIIPAHSVRPWKIKFDKSKVKIKDYKCEDLKIEFMKNMKAVQYVDVELEGLPVNLTPLGIKAVKTFVANLPRLEKGQFSISPFYVKEEDNGELGIVVIFRNATGKKVDIQKLPVKVYDAQEKLAAQGVFENLNIQLEDKKAAIKELMFRKEQRIQGDFDLSKYKVKF